MTTATISLISPQGDAFLYETDPLTLSHVWNLLEQSRRGNPVVSGGNVQRVEPATKGSRAPLAAVPAKPEPVKAAPAPEPVAKPEPAKPAGDFGADMAALMAQYS